MGELERNQGERGIAWAECLGVPPRCCGDMHALVDDFDVHVPMTP